MAKFCVKCGKALPDGVEVCSECNAQAAENEAALFTRMTAETEVWKTDPDQSKKRRRAKMARSRSQMAGLYGMAVLLVAFTVFIVLFTMPAERVVRALNKGEYDTALELYIEKLSDKPERTSRINKAIAGAAQRTCEAYAADELTTAEADRVFAALSGFGDDVVYLLEDTLARFEDYKTTRGSIDAADALFAYGEYLAAYDGYMLVLEDDSRFAYAREQAEKCLEAFAQSVMSDAGKHLLENDYPAAISALRRGNDLLAGYDTYSDSIDKKILEYLDLYEGYILTEAKNLASFEDYDAAVNLILSCTRDFGYETEELLAALEKYKEAAADHYVFTSISKALELYETTDYAGAFAELDNITIEDSELAEAVNSAVTDMENRFAYDMEIAAEEIFAGNRDNIPEALEKLGRALAIRELDAIKDCVEKLEMLLPMSLVEMAYSAKEGDVFRVDGNFDGLDGITYSDGWIWGGDGASITFNLDGNYNRFEGTYITRTDDGKSVSGHFEVWCDDTLVYTSDTLYHWETEPIYLDIDISGCEMLKIVFINDYEVSTASSGYCYHGIVAPTITKNID